MADFNWRCLGEKRCILDETAALNFTAGFSSLTLTCVLRLLHQCLTGYGDGDAGTGGLGYAGRNLRYEIEKKKTKHFQ